MSTMKNRILFKDMAGAMIADICVTRDKLEYATRTGKISEKGYTGVRELTDFLEAYGQWSDTDGGDGLNVRIEAASLSDTVTISITRVYEGEVVERLQYECAGEKVRYERHGYKHKQTKQLSLYRLLVDFSDYDHPKFELP